MGFLAPWFLAGAAVTALPLWLHLLRRYRSEPQPFSSLMFFEPRTQSSVRHRRLRYLLLLALRLGLLLLLALAFADPFVSTPPAGLSDQHVLVLALDRSFSMRYGDHMRRAKDLALQRLLRWPENGAVRVLALDSEAVFLTGAAAGRAEIRSAIAGLEAGDRGTSYAALVRALRGAAESLHRPLEVHLFSDLQQTAMPAVFADLQLPPGTRLILEGAPAKAEENWAVEAVAAPSRLFDSKKRRVSATVAGYHTPESRRTVSLVLDGRILETKSVDIPAGGRATVEFSSMESPYGMHRGEVRLNSADLLPQDDRFPFAVERAEPRRVLFLHPGGRSRAAFYYAAALAASGTSGFAAEPLPVDQASGARFASYAFVVLSDTGALSRTVESALRDYVSGGGGLLIALGSNGARAGKAPVTGQVIDGEMRPRGFETAVAAGGGQGALRGVALEQVKFFSAARIDEARGTVIARLEDGTPLLLEQPLGAGKVLTFASGLGNVSNDFPLHASFVPFVEQTARWLGGSEAGPQSVSTGTIIELHAPGEEGAAVDVTAPGGKRALTLREAATAKSFELTQDGFYEIRGANGAARLVAVHAPRQESDLAPVPPETLDLWAKSGATRPAGDASNRNRDAQPWSFGRYLLFLALLIALAESLVSVRYLWPERGIS